MNDLTIAHRECDVATLGYACIVGDKEKSDLLLMGNFFEKCEDVFGVFRVEIAGGFVSKKNRWRVGEGAGDGDTLLFASGKLMGAAMVFVSQSNGIK